MANSVTNAYVFISSTPFTGNSLADAQVNATFSYRLALATTSLQVVITTKAVGRYIRIQKSGSNAGRDNLEITDFKLYESTPCDNDLDKDGIPNHLDLDSDGDGCPDAIEGDGTFTQPNLVSSTINGGNTGGGFTGISPNPGPVVENLGNTVDMVSTSATYGVPIVVPATTAVTQDVGYSQNKDNNSSCTDTDSDGINDYVDLDDDNDGILDTKEFGPCNSPIVTDGYSVVVYDGVDNQNSWNLVSSSNSFPVAGFTQIATFDYDEFTNTSQGFNIDFEEFPYNLSTSTDGDVSNYSGTAITSTTDDDAALLFSKTIKAFEEGIYEFSIDYGDNHIFFYLNGVKQFQQQQVYLSNPNDNNYVTAISSITLNAGDVIDIILVEEDFGGTELDTRLVKTANIDGGAPTCPLDTDNDGIPNHLDLDSDGDGCPDALEGTGTFVNGDLVEDTDMDGGNTGADFTGVSGVDPVQTNLGTVVNSDGIPTLGSPLTAATQGIGFSQDLNIENCADTDGDGIPDSVDLDDDNDGILDLDECPNVKYMKLDNNNDFGFSTGVLTGNQSASNIDLSSKWDLPTGSVIVSIDNASTVSGGSSVLGGPSNGSTTYNITGTVPVFIRISHGGSIGATHKEGFLALDGSSYELISSLNFSNIESHSVGQYYYVENTDASGAATANGNNFVWVSSTSATSIEVNSTSNATNSNFSLFLEPILPDACGDMDNDGVPNHLDLDTDGDGCPDALEGEGTFETGDLVEDTDIDGGNTGAGFIGVSGVDPVQTNLGTVVNSDGIPTLGSPLTEATQAIGSSQDLNVENCTDTDGDGVPNSVDLDDDNDGILDTDECMPGDYIDQGNLTAIGSTDVTDIKTGDKLRKVNGIEIQDVFYDVIYEIILEYTPTGRLRLGDDGHFNLKEVRASENPYVHYSITIVQSGTLTPIVSTGIVSVYEADLDGNGTNGENMADIYGYESSLLISDLTVGSAVTNGGFYNDGGPAGFNYHRPISIPGPNSSGSNQAHTVSFDTQSIQGAELVFGVTGSYSTPDVSRSLELSLRSVYCDSDNDGIQNSLDLDSDADGCPDALEGNGGFNYLNLDEDDSLGSLSTTTGIPVDASGTSLQQSDVSSDNILVQSPACIIIFTIGDVSEDEGDVLVLPITLSSPSSEDTTITIVTSTGTAGTDDYTSVTTSVTIPAGATSTTVSVGTIEDTLGEGDETFTVTGTAVTTNTSNTTATATVTITDNDTVTFTIGDVSEDEGDVLVFPITLSNPSSVDTIIAIVTSTGTAGTADYTSVTTSVTIPAGATSTTVSVTTVDDTISELTEMFTVTGTVVSTNTANSTATATGTITDKDKTTFTIGDVTVDEGDVLVLPITLSNPSSEDTIITIVTSTGTAGTDDYTSVTTSVTIPAGATSTTVSVGTIEDTLGEGDETFTVTGTVVTTNTSNTTATATATITDNDTVTFTIGDVSEDEGDVLVFPITLSNPSSVDTIIAIVTSTGTAGTDDYTSVTTSVTIPAGATSTTVSVTTVDDTISELTEMFTVTGTVVSTNTANSTATATVTITDKDKTTFTIGDVTVDEGDVLVLPITLSNPSSVDTIITIVTSTGTAGTDDYTSVTTSVTIPAGATSTTVSVGTIEDTLGEGDETFTVTGTVVTTNTSNTTATATVTITDNDTVTFTIGDVTVDEGDVLVLPITLSNPSSVDTIITIVTSIGTAGTDDYTSVTTSVTIPAGATSTSVSVGTIEDTLGEGDETFTVTGTVDTTNTSNTTATATATITDNDMTTFTIGDVSEDEGDVLVFPITLSNTSSVDTIILIVTTIGTAGTDDYTSVTTSVTIPAGATSTTVSVGTIEDTTPEGDETFTVTGTALTINTSNTTATATGTIQDCLSDPLADCDGDGTPNGEELPGEELDPCLDNGIIGDEDVSNPIFANLDCDGDGVSNAVESDPDGDGVIGPDNTDWSDPCDFNHLDQDLSTVDISWYDLDCDGDTIINGDEPGDYNDNGIPDYIEYNNDNPVDNDVLEPFDIMTPDNGDGLNDVFVVRGLDTYPNNTVLIYNRWGVKVFEANGYGQNGNYFRGISNGRTTIEKNTKLPTGTYYFVINYVNNDGETKRIAGPLYINR